MRPRNLDEFVGQRHLLDDNGPVRAALRTGHLPSVLLWGPPGSGKTTLARLLAEALGARFVTLSAVASGVAEVRAVVTQAAHLRQTRGERTILFIDEIHRFNRAQQDALLPAVEVGTVTLIGATTENPFLSLTGPLLSRVRIWRLEPLTEDELRQIVARALADPDRGLAGQLGPPGGVVLSTDAADALVSLAGGDARVALNLLEETVAVAAAAGSRDPAGRLVLQRDHLEAAAQQRILAYDRAGDRHYDVASAFIKSLRGSDPDAALYWLATMIAAGEDPRFIARRMIIAASEEIGNADPQALQVAVAAAQAVEFVGLPEAQYALAQAAIYLATAPKSNRSGEAYWAAAADVLEFGPLPVPLHLRNAPVPAMRQFGMGVGYRNPHTEAAEAQGQRYLPDQLAGRRYYRPAEVGFERIIAERLEARQGEGAPEPEVSQGAPPPATTSSMVTAGRIVDQRRRALRPAPPRRPPPSSAP
jgi:putative ATPase